MVDFGGFESDILENVFSSTGVNPCVFNESPVFAASQKNGNFLATMRFEGFESDLREISIFHTSANC